MDDWYNQYWAVWGNSEHGVVQRSRGGVSGHGPVREPHVSIARICGFLRVVLNHTLALPRTPYPLLPTVIGILI